ncbi:hypothetical protein EU527_01370 [Candidatus Thorarchaeota archaeon]|nr:MAG: hypothetical protein EU527_01370 [Candidatus Thorarchaeota archaeon]
MSDDRLYFHGVFVTRKTRLVKSYTYELRQMEKLTNLQIALGLIGSSLIMIASTWGLLYLLNISGVWIVLPTKYIPYTFWMLLASVVSIVVAVIICAIMIRFPDSVGLPLRIHSFFKRGTGEYFLSPEPVDQSYRTVLRRSLYGSVLVVGIAFTFISFELMMNVETWDIVGFGTAVMWASILLLPITVLVLYYGPWLIKDSGLFHLDERDRSMSNVGDDLEDILEFFAGIDIILVWIELTLTTGFDAPWISLFVILVPLGPLFSIILNFTFVFMVFKSRATASLMNVLNRKYEVPDMITSAGYIRSRLLSLLERQILTADEFEYVPEDEPDTLQDLTSEMETAMKSIRDDNSSTGTEEE